MADEFLIRCFCSCCYCCHRCFVAVVVVVAAAAVITILGGSDDSIVGSPAFVAAGANVAPFAVRVCDDAAGSCGSSAIIVLTRRPRKQYGI